MSSSSQISCSGLPSTLVSPSVSLIDDPVGIHLTVCSCSYVYAAMTARSVAASAFAAAVSVPRASSLAVMAALRSFSAAFEHVGKQHRLIGRRAVEERHAVLAGTHDRRPESAVA